MAQLFPAPVSIVFFVLLATKKSFPSRGNKFRTPRKGFQGREFRNFAVFGRFWPARGRASVRIPYLSKCEKVRSAQNFRKKKNRKMIFDVIFFFLLPLHDLILRDADLAEDLSCRKAHPESRNWCAARSPTQPLRSKGSASSRCSVTHAGCISSAFHTFSGAESARQISSTVGFRIIALH